LSDRLLDYLLSLANRDEGETMLLTRQTPRKVNGEVQYHADGAPEATFPAFLPTKVRIRPSDAFYINTGVFIIGRFVNGKPSTSAANIEYVAFMCLDDIGTKSKTPPLKPTWIVETSPGNFQWGYIFSEQPTKRAFSSAIVAIADAGYTDPGAINPVRNVRIPGSVNLKRGKGGFVTRLVEFNEAVEYTLDEICGALGVTPIDVGESSTGTIRLKDTGTDNILAWLNEQNLVYAPPNNEGWAGVHCPNAHEHTDENPEARYRPIDRAFTCYHGHCQHLDSRAFLKWVCDSGGPDEQHGLRPEVLSAHMADAMRKIEPTEAFPDPAKVDQKIRKTYAGSEVDDIANGQMFARVWLGKLLHIPETGDVLSFDSTSGWLRSEGKKVSINAAIAVTRQLTRDASQTRDDTLRDRLIKRACKASSVHRLKAMAEVGFAQQGLWAGLNDFDADPALVGVQNGILNVETRELIAPKPSYLISKRLRVHYDPSAACLKFARFLEEVQPDPEVRRLLQQLAGVCLYGEPLIQNLIFFHGHGANGKSTFIETLAWMLGDYATPLATETLMTNHRDPQAASPDLMKLKGARLAFCNETGEGRLLDSNAVKLLTGFDTLSARPLYGSPVSFTPSHSLIMTGNHRPIIRETGEALWRRMLLIAWPVTIPAGERDPDLQAKMRAEGSGILNWALAGLADFRKTNRLAVPASVRSATDDYRTEQDIVGEWIDERLTRAADAQLQTKTAYDDYRFWCQDNGHKAMTKNSLTRKLAEKGIDRDKSRVHYLGVQLRRPAEMQTPLPGVGPALLQF
jgi:putative DNA primase/helicase